MKFRHTKRAAYLDYVMVGTTTVVTSVIQTEKKYTFINEKKITGSEIGLNNCNPTQNQKRIRSIEKYTISADQIEFFSSYLLVRAIQSQPPHVVLSIQPLILMSQKWKSSKTEGWTYLLIFL